MKDCRFLLRQDSAWQIVIIVSLNSAGIQHDSDSSSNGLGRQIASESASDNAVGSVVSAHFAPIHAERAIFGLGNKGYTLAQVEFGGALIIRPLDFDQTHVVVLIAQTTFKAQYGTVHMQTWSSFCFRS
jgi:hypothetical protein